MSEDNEHIENEDDLLLSDEENGDAGEESSMADALRRRIAAAQAKLDEPAPPKPANGNVALLSIPQGNIADLLEQQVAICVALIGNVAEFVAGPNSVESCYPFMDRIARLMSSSAKAGRTIGQLRGIAAESKQIYVKQKEHRGVGGLTHE